MIKWIITTAILIFTTTLAIISCCPQSSKKEQADSFIEDFNNRILSYDSDNIGKIDINVPKSRLGYNKMCTSLDDIQKILDIVNSIQLIRDYDIVPVPAGRGVHLRIYDADNKLIMFIGSYFGNTVTIGTRRFFCDPNDVDEQLTALYNSLDLPEQDITLIGRYY